MSRAQQAAREVADEYRRRLARTEDDTDRRILEEIGDAFSSFAAWLEALE